MKTADCALAVDHRDVGRVYVAKTAPDGDVDLSHLRHMLAWSLVF